MGKHGVFYGILIKNKESLSQGFPTFYFPLPLSAFLMFVEMHDLSILKGYNCH
jgi:hypothetical protein